MEGEVVLLPSFVFCGTLGSSRLTWLLPHRMRQRRTALLAAVGATAVLALLVHLVAEAPRTGLLERPKVLPALLQLPPSQCGTSAGRVHGARGKHT